MATLGSGEGTRAPRGGRLAVGALALALATTALATGACQPVDDRPQRNSGGGPGTNGTGTGPDARPAPDGAPVDAVLGVVSGVVCLATDLRTPAACATRAGAGVVVATSDGALATTTGSDGSFTLDLGTAAGAVLVAGAGEAGVVPSAVPIARGGSGVVLPLPALATVLDLEDGLGAVQPDGDGIVALYLTDATGAPQAGFAVTPPPGTQDGAAYDDTSKLGWTSGGTTGAAGAAILFGVPPGTFDLALDSATVHATAAGVPVLAGHVTFAAFVP